MKPTEWVQECTDKNIGVQSKKERSGTITLTNALKNVIDLGQWSIAQIALSPPILNMSSWFKDTMSMSSSSNETSSYIKNGMEGKVMGLRPTGWMCNL